MRSNIFSVPFLTSYHTNSNNQKENQRPFFRKTISSLQPFFQPKLTINQPGDKYEQEADTMAERGVQHSSGHTSVSASSITHSLTSSTLARQCAECDGSVQRESNEQDTTTAKEEKAEKNNTEDTTIQADDKQQSATPEPEPENLLSIEASVGKEGVNNIDDVRIVQNKLLELGLLSLSNYGKETPVESMESFKVKSIENKDKIEIVSVREEGKADELKNTKVLEKNISHTITAIRTFQRLIFLGWSDGTIDVGKTTLEKLKDIDKVGLEKLRIAEKERLAAEQRAKEKKEKEERHKEFLKSRAQAFRMAYARKFIRRFTSSYEIGGFELYSGVNSKALGTSLIPIRNHELYVILTVFDLLPSDDRDDVAYYVAKNLSEEELSETDPVVLERLRSEMLSGILFPDELLQIIRINKVLGQGEVEKGEGHVTVLKQKIEKKEIIFDNNSKKLENQLLNENLDKNSIRATNKLQGLVVYLSSLGEQVRISSVSSGKHAKESLHYDGRGVDIGNEEIAPKVLPSLVEKVSDLHIDEIIYDASLNGLESNTYNYDNGKPHNYSEKTLLEHRNHLHLSVKE